ncbi:hypothetical protein M3205_24860, partial [Cytobacillus firmus]|uniref:hypothetical protein n=1 Tax=Cytobacillus firmus TaxID=1399 RepID=UPI0020420523
KKQLMKNLPKGIWRVIWRAFQSITRKKKIFNKKFLTPISWFSLISKSLNKKTRSFFNASFLCYSIMV